MTRDDIIRMAQEAGFYIDPDWIEHGLPGFENFANLVAAAEREACAKLCDEIANKPSNVILGVAVDCAAAIRARGEK